MLSFTGKKIDTSAIIREVQKLNNQIEVAVYETGDNGVATFRESMIVENVNFEAFEIGDMFFSPDDKRYVYLGEPEGCVKLLEVA